MTIYYKEGYKYQLVNHYSVEIDIKPEFPIKTDYINLTTDGTLVIKNGYAFDGPSGPTIDTPNFMRGSLVHDALYQLIRQKMVAVSHRSYADRLLRQICREDGMSAIRAWWVYQGVKNFGKSSAVPGNKKEVIKAP